MGYALNAAGRGALVTCLIVYLTRVVGLETVEVGAALTTAGLIGLLVGVPFGHLADQVGPRRTAVVLSALSGLTCLLYLCVDSFVSLMLVTCLFTVTERGGSTAREALLATVITNEAVTTRAYLRSISNIGMALGTGIAGIALAVHTRPVYLGVIALNTVCLLLCGAILSRLPEPEGRTGKAVPGNRLPVLRDRPYILVTLLNVVMLLQAQVLEIAIPLWLAQHTQAPRFMVAALLVLNTVGVVLFQVRVSRRIGTLDSALLWWRRSGLVLFVVCAVFAASAGRSALLASVVLLVGAVLHVYAEMLQSAAGWVFSLDLAPDGKQGQYQGLFNTSFPLAQMIAPSVLLPLVLGWGAAGWIVLGAVFAVAGFAMVPVVGWAVRTRSISLDVENTTEVTAK
ncbi:MFS transporter [Streptomyces sp. NPDC001966]